MIYSQEVEMMCPVAQGANHGPAPIPEEAKWVQAKEIKDISGFTHGVGWCAPQQGACKLSLNVKNGVIEEALIETIGCSGAGLEDLGKGLRSQVGTMYATKEKGVRYLEMAEGYVTGIALDEDNEVIGYQFVSLGKMTDFIKKGDDPNTAWEKAKGQYGRVADAVKIIDPRKE